MAETPFESRMRAAGLRLWPEGMTPESMIKEDMPKLELLVRDLDRAAAALRGPREYALEPLSAFRLHPAGR